ncbi:diphosphomevalonate decarboxylase [Anthonomus grandis grandis]|uniref:diphosphomevalonate decarboxylase n=1 Tax=Anthonomus grandis grandis TaxID=2921223 RepID=UPI0021666CE5|nr:diphosphomevalonate decarboxylase [Anthonomus grandis grandis]
MKVVTCIAPVNIAVIKYWGKKDEELILPLNDSISASLSTDIMCAKTTVMASPSFEKNRFWLNGKIQCMETNTRLSNCIEMVKKRADSSLEHYNWNISICSENNFPTAAGLASSAAGYACLVYALAKLYKIEGEISEIARQGSGSACRSVYGGWVQWHSGTLPTGEDSIASQIAPASHWPEMRALVLVANDSRKKFGSTLGMYRTTKTSTLIWERVNKVVPERVKQMRQAILSKNFESFAEITMKDSNSMHAVILDTYPPGIYMNDISQAMVNLVHCYNDYKGHNSVAYTFDAGPNACIYLLESEVDEFIAVVNYVFPKLKSVPNSEYYKGYPLPDTTKYVKNKELNVSPCSEGMLKYIIYTRVGEGPSVLVDQKEHLLQQNGLPKH